MITELSFTNFKSWQAVEKMRLAPITGLFGTNSSGKTSVLQLLLMLKQTIESSDRAQVLEFGDEKSLTNLGSFRDAVYNHIRPGAMSFGLAWNLAKALQISSPEDKDQTLFSADQLSFCAKSVKKARIAYPSRNSNINSLTTNSRWRAQGKPAANINWKILVHISALFARQDGLGISPRP